MALVSAGFSQAGVNTATSALANVKAAANTPLRLLEIGLFVTTLPTNPPDIGLRRMNAVGTGAITSTAGATHETGHTALGVLETAWATARPTITGSYFRRGTMPLVLGAGIIWQLGPNGIFIPAAGGLVIETITASGATLGVIEGYVSWDE